MNQNLKKVSVVIVGRNEGDRLVQCVLSVKKMSFPQNDIEIIYVDSGSDDGSPDRIAEFNIKTIRLNSPHSNASKARNAGWRAASGFFILFLDADTILDPEFINCAIHEFKDPKIAIVWGHRRELHPYQSIYTRVMDLDWIYLPGFSNFCGGDALVRRSVLQEVDGYNEEIMGGEDPEMCTRIRMKGYIILHIDQPMTRHDLAINRWSQYWRRATRSGYVYAEISQHFHGHGLSPWEGAIFKNFIHAMFLAMLFFLCLISIVLFHSIHLALIPIVIVTILVIRTGIANRWKTRDRITCLLYGIHCQFQKLPLAVGQLIYYFRHSRRYSGHFFEYKKAR